MSAGADVQQARCPRVVSPGLLEAATVEQLRAWYLDCERIDPGDPRLGDIIVVLGDRVAQQLADEEIDAVRHPLDTLALSQHIDGAGESPPPVSLPQLAGGAPASSSHRAESETKHDTSTQSEKARSIAVVETVCRLGLGSSPVSFPDARYVCRDTEPHWLDERRKYITGTSAYRAVLGERWKVWAEKAGVIEPENLDHVERVTCGRFLEPAIRALYESETGRRVFDWGTMYASRRWPHAACTIDGLTEVDGKTRLVEIKNIDAWCRKYYDPDWRQWRHPHAAKKLVQVQHSMAVLGLESADLVALFGGNTFRVYTIERHDAYIDWLMAETLKLHVMIVDSVEPPPDDSKECQKALSRLYPVDDAEPEALLPPEFDALADRDDEITDTLKALDVERRGIRNKVRKQMENSTAAVLAATGELLYRRSKNGQLRRAR